MITIYTTENGKTVSTPEICRGAWVSLIAPDAAEIEAVAAQCGVDADYLRTALDPEERSHIEIDTDCTLILVNIPTRSERDSQELYDTVPLAILQTDDLIITVCAQNSPLFCRFTDGKIRDFSTAMKSRFILQLLYATDSLYLQYLREIDRRSETVEKKLHKSTQNRELIELLRLEKSLVYFTTSLRSNEMVLEKLLRTDALKKYPEDTELLEDVIVENKQAIEMANIYSGILSGTMDAFASVISNNLNIVMKVLSIITIVMAIPTMIFSAYGMNVNTASLPFAASPYAFPILLGVSLTLSAAAAILLTRLKTFR